MDDLWPIVQAGHSMETLSGKAGNCRSCPGNQRVREMTMAGYLEHLNTPAIIIMKIYLNLVPRLQVHQQGFSWPRSSPWTYTHWVSAPSSCLTKEPQGEVMIMTDQLYMPQFLEGINQEKEQVLWPQIVLKSNYTETNFPESWVLGREQNNFVYSRWQLFSKMCLNCSGL